jgi:DNA-directed RNA polymerase specialized sigma subunit
METLSRDLIEHAEKEIDNRNHVLLVYALVENDRDRFILMATLHLGYPQQEVAMMLGGISQAHVSKRLKAIREMLKETVGSSVII